MQRETPSRRTQREPYEASVNALFLLLTEAGCRPGPYPPLSSCRYNKSLMLVALLAEKLGPRCLRGRWLTPERALHPPEEVPAEALNYLEP